MYGAYLLALGLSLGAQGELMQRLMQRDETLPLQFETVASYDLGDDSRAYHAMGAGG